MKEKKNKKEFQLPVNLDSTRRDKYNPEIGKLKNIGESAKALARANEILEKYPIPQWILDNY